VAAPARVPCSELLNNQKTLGLIVDEYLPLRAVNLEFHDPSNESITLNPTKLSNEILRNREGVVLSIPNLPRLKLNNLNTQAVPQIKNTDTRN